MKLLFLSCLQLPASTIYRYLNLILTVLLPAFSMLQGETTVFYIVYLYWWHELIASILDVVYSRRLRMQDKAHPVISFLGARLFLLGVYLVFIVTFFGFISSWENKEALKINITVFFFKDSMFTLNLAAILVNEWWWRSGSSIPVRNIEDPFTGRMLVMHLSIILGAIISFMVVKRFPELFSSTSLWGSVAVSLPFLVLKAFMTKRLEQAAQNNIPG